MAGKTKDLKKDGEAYASDLTEAGAKELLSFGGRRGGNAPEPKNAKGSVKFWVKDGLLAKYELKLQGTVTFNGEDRIWTAPRPRNQGRRHHQSGRARRRQEEALRPRPRTG